MTSYDLKLLDCTLRDGGYVNDWKFGFNSARDIINWLTKANIDVVEVGFLRNVEAVSYTHLYLVNKKYRMSYLCRLCRFAMLLIIMKTEE